MNVDDHSLSSVSSFLDAWPRQPASSARKSSAVPRVHLQGMLFNKAVEGADGRRRSGDLMLVLSSDITEVTG